MSLTLRQQAVVDSNENCECVALPGSGKSHTVVQYIKHKINECEFNKLLAISFTRKASQELRDRLKTEMGSDGGMGRIGISTFDAIFIKQIKEALGIKQLRLMSNGERINLISRALNATNSSLTVGEAIGYIDKFGSYIQIPRSLVDEKPDAYEVFTKYTKLRKQKKMWDFPSVAVTVVDAQNKGIIPLLPITHLVIDEFQDTNDIQFQWVAAYAKKNNVKLLVVGDDDQAIYGFRNSLGYKNFLNFKEIFNPETHILDTCFRCKPDILHCARSLIEFNTNRVPKEMVSNFDAGGVVKTWLIEDGDKSDEYNKGDNEIETIINRLQECLLPSNPKFSVESPKHWAVLARTNRQLWAIAAKLEALGIDYRTKPSESILCSPMADIINKFMFTVANEKKTWIADLLSWFGASEEDINQSRRSGGLSKRFSLANYRIDGKELPETIDEVVHFYINRFIREQPNLDNGIQLFRELINERKNFTKDKGNNYESTIDNIIRIFITTGDELSFIQSSRNFMKMTAKANKQNNEIKEFTDGVDLLTMHSSKGLQWDAVWVMGLSDGVFPSEDAEKDAKKNKLEAIEEERRLLYVAMTRAKSELNLSANNDYSRFLHEMGDYLNNLKQRVDYPVFHNVTLKGEVTIK